MNKYTQDMTGTGQHIELPDQEPERYYDWMLWKLRQSPEWKKAIYSKPTFTEKLVQEVCKIIVLHRRGLHRSQITSAENFGCVAQNSMTGVEITA